MRPRSLFLNLSRGFVVDHDALRDTSRPGTSPARRSTCSPTSPRPPGDAFVSSLRGLPNVILTPHIGGSTEEAQQDIGRFVAGKLRDFADGGQHHDVGQPAAGAAWSTSGRQPASLHLHHNVPGVLATVNGVLADHGVNIEGQVLATRGELGYVITDIGGALTPGPDRQARGLPETVRLRVIG